MLHISSRGIVAAQGVCMRIEKIREKISDRRLLADSRWQQMKMRVQGDQQPQIIVSEVKELEELES